MHWTTILDAVGASVTRKNRQMSLKKWPKMILLKNWKILTPLQKLPRNMGNLGKLIVVTGFGKLPKVQ